MTRGIFTALSIFRDPDLWPHAVRELLFELHAVQSRIVEIFKPYRVTNKNKRKSETLITCPQK